MTSTADDDLDAVARLYAIKTTPYLDRLLAGRPADDPLVRQYRAQAAELTVTADELADPIGDFAKSPVPGIVHRYPDRVLLKPVHVCAAYCRFCFRREQVGPGGEALDGTGLDAALAYVAAHPEVFEVILTGGDPLLLSPRRLGAIVGALDAVAHVAVLRVHTRLPFQDPERIDGAMIEALHGGDRLSPWLAVHVNHADEFTPQAVAALTRLRAAGLPLVAQSVLLKGVNDNVETLDALFRACLRHGVKPYYLHHPDLARGTGHFRPEVATGRALMRQLRGRLSGLGLPTYVFDRPGGLGKVPLGPQWPEDWPEDWG